MVNRESNLARLGQVDKIGVSDVNYLVYLSFHDKLKKSINKFARGKLLDIGCGNKPYLNWTNGIVSEYIGCDIVQSSLNIVDIVCEANSIPLMDNSFDTVLSTQTIEHVEDYQGLLSESFRLLKREGYLILSGPMYWYLHEEPYDFLRFTKYGFKYILEKQGFEVIEIHENGGAWATLGIVINHTLTFFNKESPKYIKGIKYLFRKCKVHILINKIFSYLDSKDSNTINTMNYVVIAKKPSI